MWTQGTVRSRNCQEAGTGSEVGEFHGAPSQSKRVSPDTFKAGKAQPQVCACDGHWQQVTLAVQMSQIGAFRYSYHEEQGHPG